MDPNPKDDRAAKLAFAKELTRRGFESVTITGAPADLTAWRNGEAFYYEVKYTYQSARYFGAATLTEWEAAVENAGRFFFVVALIRNGVWIFHEYTPDEFMQFSYIPPFKVFFNVAVHSVKDQATIGRSKKVLLSRERLRILIDLYREFRRT